MAEYNVCIVEQTSTYFTVEADSKDLAFGKATKFYGNFENYGIPLPPFDTEIVSLSITEVLK